MCDSWKIAAEQTQKAAKRLVSKRDKLQHDKMESHVQAFFAAQDYIEHTSTAQLKFVNDVHSLILQPLTNFYKDNEKKRKTLIQQEEKIHANMLVAKTQIKKERDESMKVWRELKMVQEEMLKDASEKASADADVSPLAALGSSVSLLVSDGIGLPESARGHMRKESTGTGKALIQKQKNAEKKLQKSQSLVQKTRERAQKSFQRFEGLIADHNKLEKKHRDEELPGILTALEKMELDRLTLIEVYLKKFVELRTKMEKKHANLTQALENQVNKLDTPTTVKLFIQTAIKTYGTPPPLTLMKYDLPCRPEMLKEDSEALKKLLAEHSQIPPPSPSILSHAPSLSSLFPVITEEKEDQLSDDEGAAPSSPPRGSGNVLTDVELRTILVSKIQYDYNSGDPHDLVLQKGQYVRIVSKNEDNKDDRESLMLPNTGNEWWHGFLLAGYQNVFWRENCIGLLPCNYIDVLPFDSSIELRAFVEYPSAVKTLREFLESEYSAENLGFWLAVQEFHSLAATLQEENIPVVPRKSTQSVRGSSLGDKKDKDAKKPLPPPLPAGWRKGKSPESPLLARAQAIIEKYIADTAPEQVNIMGATKEAILDMVSESATSEKRVTAEMFDQAQSEIYSVLNRDAFYRFKKTDSFQRLCDSYKAWTELHPR